MAIQPPTIGNGAEGGPSTSSGGNSSGYKLIQNLSGHSRSVTALEWTHDGETLISAGKYLFTLQLIITSWHIARSSSSLAIKRVK